MVNVYLLPADEGDFIWVKYGEKENYANILIDGGTKDSGAEYAEVIEFIESNGEAIEAIILTHIDYDHLQGTVDGISRVSSETLKKTVKRILFNTCRGILRQQGQTLAKNEYAEDQIKGNIFSGGYGIEDTIAFMELLKKKEIDDRLIDYIVSGSKLTWDKGAKVSFISPGKKELDNFIKKWEPYCRGQKTILYTSNSEFVQNNLEMLMRKK